MLYTIGDLHLSFEADKPMDIFGGIWENHAQKLIKGFSNLTENDMCVICGDLTWGMDMKSCLEDFKFIDRLPGKKIILKGNHDFWWTTGTKTRRFFKENNINSIEILNNNCFLYDDIAICGTRGWVCPSENQNEHDKKMLQRETMRLEASLKAAGDAKRKMCFLHYPPIFGKYACRDMIAVMKAYGVEKCYYGHVHGKGHSLAYEGEASGIEYKLVSADYIDFTPVKID